MSDTKIFRWPFISTLITNLVSGLAVIFIAFYMNPFVISAFDEANIEIPHRILRFAGISDIQLIAGWLLLSVVLFWKDKFFPATKAIILNIFILALTIVLIVCYPVLVDVIHLPMAN